MAETPVKDGTEEETEDKIKAVAVATAFILLYFYNLHLIHTDVGSFRYYLAKC